MVDKFGGIGRKYRGPPGPPGKDALELETWAPHSVLRMFRENEVCTFYCNTAEDGILYDGKEKPIGLKDRYTEFKPHHKSKMLYVFKIFKNRLNWIQNIMVFL